MNYHDVLASKRVAFEARGFDKIPALNSALFPHQAEVVEFLLRAGCGAAFLDTGLGKTFVALEWGRVIVELTNRPVLMLAPLAVGPQHAREAALRGIDAAYVREPPPRIEPKIYITNYERMHLFDLGVFVAVDLDESSILKSFTGKTTNALIKAFEKTPYRLANTATPAPNDHTELGQHSAFLGVMRSPEMLSRWFITDQSEMGRYRLKRPAVRPFWDWVASWARCVSKPSDLGHSDDGFDLPELRVLRHIVRADRSINAGEEKDGQGRLFRMPEMSATSISREKKLTIEARADVIGGRVAALSSSEPYVAWCDTNVEADALMERLGGSGFLEVRGDMRPEMKEERLVAFSEGKLRGLVTKASIAGFGLNWQHCAHTGLVGLNFSYESYYQLIRRFWRFGQKRDVTVDVAMADTESPVADVVLRKETDHDAMKDEMRGAMRRAAQRHRALEDYVPTRRVTAPAWLFTKN